jgi:hypothetical protein
MKRRDPAEPRTEIRRETYNDWDDITRRIHIALKLKRSGGKRRSQEGRS